MENDFWESDESDIEGQEQELETDYDSVLNSEEVNDDLTDQDIELEMLQDTEETDDSELLSNARLRLEQGRLYEMLLKHDLFSNVEADSRAIANVQKEIRSFIKERLEVLLGLKTDPKLVTSVQKTQSVSVSPFNDLEVSLIKKLLVKLSKGATEQFESQESTEKLSPVVSTQQSTINPVGKKAVVKVSTNTKTVKQPPSQINISNKKIKKILEEKFGENEMPLGKPAYNMRASELRERNKRISQRQAARKSFGTGRMAAPSPDQEAAIMMQHVMTRNESLQSAGVNPLTLAVSKAIADKAGQTESE